VRQNDPSIYPPADVIQKLEPGLPLDPKGQRRREAVWREMRG
jgi:hypothetical protein